MTLAGQAARRSWAKTRPGAVRLLGALVVILGVVTITFLLTRVFSADPTGLFVSPTADAAVRAQVRESLGLNDPILVQYLRFIADLVQGNLGTSYMTGQTVTSDLASRLPATLELSTYALLAGGTAGIAAGVVAAVRKDGVLDHIVRFLTVGALALPQFWLGLMLLWLFFVLLGIAPGPTGRLPIGVAPPPTITGFFLIDSALTGNWALLDLAARQLALPVITLGFGAFAPIARTARSAMVHALEADYIRTATAMGLSRPRIWFVYGLKNGMLPVVTILAGVIGWAFSGAVLVEGIFGWPGVGQYALNAIQSSDFPAVQGFVLYAAILYVLIYVVLDVLYARIDPRVRS